MEGEGCGCAEGSVSAGGDRRRAAEDCPREGHRGGDRAGGRQGAQRVGPIFRLDSMEALRAEAYNQPRGRYRAYIAIYENP